VDIGGHCLPAGGQPAQNLTPHAYAIVTLFIHRKPSTTGEATMPAQISRMPATAATPAPQPPQAKLTKAEQAQQDKFQEFLVVLDNQAIDKVNKAFKMPVGEKRRNYVYKTLRDNMSRTQEPLWGVLDGLQASGHIAPENGYKPLWIENAIIVKGDDTAMTTLASAAGVAHSAPSELHLLGATSDREPEANAPTSAQRTGKGLKNDPQWNIARIHAADAWKDGLTGKGVKMVSVDTGVQVDHPALLTNFAGYDPNTGSVDITGNWMDTTGESPNEMRDDEGHGTHTTGTAVGFDGRTNHIGVAPDGTWSAVRGLGEQGGTDGMLLSAFQYAVAPTVPNPGVSPGTRREIGLGADVINNSWGSDDGLSNSYLPALRNMAAMGVINVFAAGNDGKYAQPSTLGSPASSPYVVSVGATDRNDKPAYFSSRGPNPMQADPNEAPSPFIAMPGEDVRSSVPGDLYERGWNGTSMATPAATGLIMLAQQAAVEETGKKFDLTAMKEVLKRAAEDVGPKGPDTATGYGIPVATNLRKIVHEVAVDNGLLAKPRAKKTTRAKTAKA
jgi:bacillopeptidase F